MGGRANVTVPLNIATPRYYRSALDADMAETGSARRNHTEQQILPLLAFMHLPSFLPLTGLGESRCHFVLRGVNVARSPAALGAEGHQCLNQHLKYEGSKPIKTEYF